MSILSETPTLRSLALSKTSDINEAYLVVHRVVLGALRKGEHELTDARHAVAVAFADVRRCGAPSPSRWN